MRHLRPLLALALLVLAGRAGAQSLTDGGLVGTILDLEGRPISEATVTLERGGTAVRFATTDADGRVRFAPLAAGRYDLLAEQVGFQPVRTVAIVVLAGRESSVGVRLERRPPPIDAPVEVVWSGSASGGTRLVDGPELGSLDWRRDATDVTRGISSADLPRGGRPGLVGSAGGLLPGATRLVVDGVEELLLRHPGLPSEGATAPIFARDGIGTAEWLRDARDVEWRAAPGGLLAMQSARGGGATTVRPWLSYSGSSLGGAAADNPADSSTSSIQAGIAMGGPLKGDTANWFVRLDYQQLALPTADPFSETTTGEQRDALAAALEAVNAPGTLDPSLRPTVRRWEGLTGAGRFDWRFPSGSRLAVRLGVASWNEDAPIPGDAPQQGAGLRLEASDVSGMALFTTGSERLSSETRLAVRSSSRDWLGTGAPAVSLASEGFAFGGAATFPGTFTERLADLTETLLFQTGIHRIKVGGTLGRRAVNYDWLANGAGRADYGSLDGLSSGIGAWTIATASGAAPDISITELTAFAQDVLQVSPDLEVMVGLRYEAQSLPDDAIGFNEDWARVSGFRNNAALSNRSGAVGPRAGFTWNLGGEGRTIVRGTAGLIPGRYDVAALAEAARADGGVSVRRAVGDIGFPTAALGTARTLLTTFGPEVRQPRSFAASLGLSQAIAPGTTLHLSGGIRHADYLLRRSDLNRVGAPLATGADGRPIWGALEQFGGLVTALPGSNRRFDEFDHVFGLTSTGYADYQEVTAAIERRLDQGLTLLAEYTWSKTEDNLPGQRSADPADRLLPFDAPLDGAAWEEGISDLDVPHRLAVSAFWNSTGTTPLRLGVRWRMQSGLPFTPSFRAGVDVNGDGSGANDPIAPTAVAGVAGLLDGYGCASTTAGGFVTRNACREPSQRAFDVHAAVGLPIGGARRVMLTVDAFNLGARAMGVVDRAAALVDPEGTITTTATGRLALPLVANPGFGGLLSRRGDPRVVRIGLRVEN